MSRLFALLKKELWEHAAVGLGAGALMALILGVLLLGNALAPRTMTVLEGHASFVRIFLPLFGLALGHRLIVREYHGRTQRFLEALPIRRWEMVLLKYTLGFTVLCSCAALSLASFALIAMVKEPMTARWLVIVLSRTAVFTWVLWSVLFTMGLVGRWRIPIYVTGGLVLIFLQTGTNVEVSRLGPFALVSDTLVLERLSMPWTDLGVSLLVALGLTVLGALLALLNEGSIAEAMAKTMSRREKAAVGMAIVGGLVIMDIADAKPDKEPFSFESDAVVRVETPSVSVLYLDEANRAPAEGLAALVQADLRRLEARLTLARLPAVHVALRPTMEPYRSERVELEDDDHAVLFRAAFTDPGFDRDAFRAALIEEVLSRASDGRAAFEPNRWVQRGFAGWLVEEPHVSTPTLLRALVVARSHRPSGAALSRFLLLEEELGPELSGAWALSAVSAVAEASSEEQLVAFAREVVGREPAWGMRAVFAARAETPLDRLERTTGLTEADFEAAWAETLRRYGRDPRSEPLAELPEVSGSAEVEVLEGELRQVRWDVSGRGAADFETCTLLHSPLGPFDRPLEESALQREELPCEDLAGDGAVMVGRYGPGERVFLAVEVTSASLGVPLRVHASRREVR